MNGSIITMSVLSGTLSPVASLSGTLTVPRIINPDINIYDGSYIVTPRPFNDTVLETMGKKMLDDVTVLKVPYYETSNIFDGETVYIADENELIIGG